MNKLISRTKEHPENHLDYQIPKWFAVYTHYKREKASVKYLLNANIEAYLPIQNLTRRYSRKVKKVELPLINHYIFVKITKREYALVLQCPYVMNFVKFSKNLISIPTEEIDLIKCIIGENTLVELDNSSFEKGDEVEVIGGQLTGLKGTLVNKENNQYLSVQLTNIGVSINVSISTHLLRKINKR